MSTTLDEMANTGPIKKLVTMGSVAELKQVGAVLGIADLPSRIVGDR